MKLISGKNYFNEESFKNMTDELEKGEQIEVSISCIGHTLNNMLQENYKKALIEKYNDKLDVTLCSGYCSYSYKYRLIEK